MAIISWHERILTKLRGGPLTVKGLLGRLGPGARGDLGIFIYGDFYASIQGFSRPVGDALNTLVRSGRVRFVAGPRGKVLVELR